MAPRKKSTPTNLNNKLTLDGIVKDSAKYKKLKKIILEDGRHTQIYINFSSVRIDEMFNDYAKFIADYQKNIGVIDDVKSQDYLNLHILLWFSTLTDKLDFTFEEKVLIFEKLLENDLSELIFDEFDKKELEKVYVRAIKKVETVQEILKNDKDMRNKARKHIEESDDIQNKELMLSTFFGVPAQEENSGDADANV